MSMQQWKRLHTNAAYAAEAKLRRRRQARVIYVQLYAG